MSLSPQLNKLVRLIDQSLYVRGYLISNSEGGEGGRKRERGGNVNVKTRVERVREGERKREKEKKRLSSWIAM